MLHEDDEQFQSTKCQLPVQRRLLREVVHKFGHRLDMAIKPVLGNDSNE